MASVASGDASRQALEQAKTLPIAEARKSVLGLARTQPLTAVVEPPAAAQPRRVRPVAQLPVKPVAEARPIAPVAQPKPIAPVAQPKPIAKLVTMPTPAGAVPAPPPARVKAPAMTAGILPPAKAAGDDGWSQGRKRNRGEPASPLRPLKVAEGTQPGVKKSPPRTASATAPRTAERPKLAEGSIAPPPAAARPLPSLLSVIDRKPGRPGAASSSSKLPGLPPPPPSRPSLAPKKAVSTVVAAASIGSAPLGIAVTRQSGQHAVVPPPAQLVLDDEMIEEIEEIEEDLPDFVPMQAVVVAAVVNARPAPRAAAPARSAPLFDAPPRHAVMPAAATSFSAAEAAFFAAGEEMDTLDMDGEQETFDDLPGIERPSFWSRLKNRASAG